MKINNRNHNRKRNHNHKNTRKKNTHKRKLKINAKTKTRKKSSIQYDNKSPFLQFNGFPHFNPNLTPRDIFLQGSFGGTYWRPIYSKVVDKKLKNQHLKYPKQWWKDIPDNSLTSTEYDNSKNRYNVKVGTSLEFWESKGWIDRLHPYGWIEWYCDFYQGKRSYDDERQIKRWKGIAGPKGRFMRFLVTQIIKKKGKWNDETISPKIRQVLQHWGYTLTKNDFQNELIRRKQNNS